MHKFFLRFNLVLVTLLGLLLISSFSVSAQTKAGFTVKPVQSDTNNHKDYFELKVNPATVQTMKITIKNTSSSLKTFKVEPNTAYTGASGLIQYNLRNTGKKVKGKLLFSKMAGHVQRVSLKAGKSKTLTFKIKIPEKSFSGTVVGGLYIKEETNNQDEKKSSSKSSSGIQLKNTYAVAIPVFLSEQDKVVHTKLLLENVKPASSNKVPVILAKISNQTPTVFGQLKITSEVLDSDGSTVISKSSKTNMQMAPNSNFNYAISTNDKSIKAGKYTLKLEAQSGSRHWDFSKKFTISKKTAARVNKKIVTKHNYSWIWFSLAALIVLLLLALAYWLGKRRNFKK